MKTKLSYTPGPWTYGGPWNTTIYGPSGHSLASLQTDTDEAKANARLIAAAPGLLEGAKLAATWLEIAAAGNTSDDNPYARSEKLLRAAIAKAEGD